MKRTLLFLSALLMAISGAWAQTQTATWTSGVSFLTASSDAAATIAAAGTNDINEIVEDSKMYRLMQKWTGTAFYLYSNTADGKNGNRLWKSKTKPDVINANYVWEAKSSGENWKFYNIGGDRWIARASHDRQDGTGVNALSATNKDNAEAFELISAISCDYPPSDFSTVNYVALKATSRTTYLNSYNPNNNFVGWNNAVHAGYYFKFIPVKKVTFTEAVAVNGGDAVSTIYVAADGSDSFTLPSSKLYSINGAAAVTNTEAVDAIAAGTSDITVTVSDNPNRNVTYILNWSDGTQLSQVADVTAYLNASSSEFLPSAMANDFVTLSYSPETITSETSEVVVTATWNGPFQLSDNFASAKWYTVGIHTTFESQNHIWKYDSDNSDIIATEAVPTKAYASLSDKNYFCFVGNPYNGFSIYNKAAGSGMTLYKSTTNNEHAKMAAEGSLFVPDAPSEDGNIADGYACFKLKNSDVRLNCYASDSYNVNGWTDSGNGSTCWFKTPSSYPLNFLNGFVLTAPTGAVGTVDVPADVMVAANDLKKYFTNNPFYFATANVIELNMVLQTLNKLAAASVITLGDGYYQIVSAYSSFTNKPAMYFDSSNRKIRWSVEANRENNINAIFKFARTEGDNAYSIYSGNGQNYLSNGGGALGDLTAVTITEAASGTAQYSFYLAEGYNDNHHYLYALGHNNGAGTSGDLTAWDAGANSASAWYIVKVDELPLTLNKVEPASYATLYVDFPVAIPEGNKSTAIYTLSESDGVYTCYKQTSVPPRTGIIIRDISAASSVTLSIPSTYNEEVKSVLTGSFLDTTASSDCYIFSKGEEGLGFYLYTSGSPLAANKAYLETSSSIRGFALSFNDTETGISETETFAKDSKLFDLQGRHIAKPQHGIYIVNGKKVLF